MRIHCTERIIEEVDVRLGVAGSSQGNACSLSPWDIESSLSNLSVKAIRELSEIFFELAYSHYLGEALFVERKAEENVIAYWVREDTRLLLDVAHSSCHIDAPTGNVSLTKKWGQKRTLATAHSPYNCEELAIFDGESDVLNYEMRNIWWILKQIPFLLIWTWLECIITEVAEILWNWGHYPGSSHLVCCYSERRHCYWVKSWLVLLFLKQKYFLNPFEDWVVVSSSVDCVGEISDTVLSDGVS